MNDASTDTAAPIPPFDILLVDDSSVDAQIFETALKESSSRVRVYWVASGEEAMDFLFQRRRFEKIGSIKLVVLDIHLPGQDGFEILRQIKSDPNLNRTPVAMLTSVGSQDEIDLAYSLGVNAYFRKPATFQSYAELLRVMAQHWLDHVELPRPQSRRSLLSREQRMERELEPES